MGLTAVDYHAAMIFVDAVVVFAELVRVFFCHYLVIVALQEQNGVFKSVYIVFGADLASLFV